MSLNTGLAQTALDSRGLAELRHAATQDKSKDETLEKVAGQFESLFLRILSIKNRSRREILCDCSILDISAISLTESSLESMLQVFSVILRIFSLEILIYN